MDEQGQEHVEELTLEAPAAGRSRRPRALWAVLAVVGVAAGALVVTSTGDDGDPRPGLPVDLASATRSGGADAESAADAMLAWVEYVPGDALPALGGDGTAYRLSGEVDEGRVRELAGALGLAGDVESDGAGSWSVLGDGGQGQLRVHGGGGGGWVYFAGYSDCVEADGSVGGCSSAGEECVRKGDVTECTFDETSAERSCPAGADCALPTTTTTIQGDADCATANDAACPDDTAAVEAPDTGSDCVDDDCISPDAARRGRTTPPDDVAQAALDVVAAAGQDVDGAIVSAMPSGGEAGTGSWYVTVEPRLDEVPSGLDSYVEVSADLQVISGNGYVGQPEAAGDFPLLDTRAAIERANQQSGDVGGIEPALGAAEDAVAGTTGSTDAGGADDVEATVTTTVAEGTDPCAAPEGASDGCIEPTTTTANPCKVQPDGSEICEVSGCENGTMSCPPAEPCPDDPQSTTTVPCIVPTPDPVPLPEPQPVAIVLVDAERSLVQLPANDGSGDAYLVPAYRFTAQDGGTVDLPAVADEALSGPVTTETTVPDTVEPAPVPLPEPQPCEVLEEQDPESATTHTVQTCPPPSEDALQIGGDGYYVDIDVECGGGTFELGGRIWITEDEEVAGWADPGERHEGGMFTLDAEDHGTFVGDANGTLTAEFHTLGPAEDIFCTPRPR